MIYKPPFEEVHISGRLYLREFKSDVDEEQLIWHLDKEDRIISVVKGSNWKINYL